MNSIQIVEKAKNCLWAFCIVGGFIASCGNRESTADGSAAEGYVQGLNIKAMQVLKACTENKDVDFQRVKMVVDEIKQNYKQDLNVNWMECIANKEIEIKNRVILQKLGSKSIETRWTNYMHQLSLKREKLNPLVRTYQIYKILLLLLDNWVMGSCGGSYIYPTPTFVSLQIADTSYVLIALKLNAKEVKVPDIFLNEKGKYYQTEYLKEKIGYRFRNPGKSAIFCYTNPYLDSLASVQFLN